MAKLDITSAAGAGSSELSGDTVVVGSGARCGIVVSGDEVSEEHAEFRRVGDGWKVVDLESRHGTRVNGRYVNQHDLAEGDVVELGAAKLVFSASAASAPIPVVAPSSPAKRAAPKRPAAKRPAAKRGAPRRAPASESPPARGRRRGRREEPEEDEEDAYDAREERRDRSRRERERKKKLVVAFVAIPVVAIGLWATLSAMTGEGPINERVRRRMNQAKNDLEWQQMIEIAKEAVPDDNDFDYQQVQLLLAEAKEQAGRAQDMEKVDQAAEAWRDVQLWRQGNWEANDEFVERIDAYLAEYGAIGGAAAHEARKQRMKVSGSVAAGEPKNAADAWARLQAEAEFVAETGQYGPALRKLEAFWEKYGATNLGLRAEKEKMRKSLLDGAKKYFGRKLYSARKNAEQGAGGKARRILAEAASTIDMPEYHEKAQAELKSLE